MSLEIPSACAPVCCAVCHGLAACAARGARPISSGSRQPAASRRNDVVCAHLVWSGPSQGLGVESQRRPRRLWQWTPLPGCCMSAAIWLVLFFFGVRMERSCPEELWGRARIWANPGNASPRVQQAGEERAGAPQHRRAPGALPMSHQGQSGNGTPGQVT